VHFARGEDEVVPVCVAGVAGLARGLDDPAGTVECPLATTTLVMTAPVSPLMRMPWKLSLPLAAAAAGAAVQSAAAVPVASSAPVSCRFMLPPAPLAACSDARTGVGLRATSVAVSGVR
jgi:hypothetical protein